MISTSSTEKPDFQLEQRWAARVEGRVDGITELNNFFSVDFQTKFLYEY